jgi:hypothetical protein
MFNSKKGLTSTLPSHFSVDKIDHEYFEEDLSKILN